MTPSTGLNSWMLELVQQYFPLVWEEQSVVFHKPWQCFLDERTGEWISGVHLNAAECCLVAKGSKSDSSVAIVTRDEGDDDRPMQRLTLAELRANVRYKSHWF